jgi:hypothetical protein
MTEQKSDLKKLASRRFILAITTILIVNGMLWADRIDPENYENIIIWLSGIYILGKPFGDRVSEFLNRINTDK